MSGVMTIMYRTLLGVLIAAGALAAQTFTAEVIGVTDGDTIKLLDAGRIVRARLHGIDCPESGQAVGSRAKQFTSELAFGQEVTVIARDTDRYGRMVAEVRLPDGRILNHEIVKAGLAWWYRKYAYGDEFLERLEREARQAKLGLWMDTGPVPPWEWRKDNSGHRVHAVFARSLKRDNR